MAAFPPLPRFLALYGVQYAAYGVASPFLPGLLQQDGLGAGALGIVLAAGTAIRLLAGPAGGRLADRGRASTVFTGFAAAAALIALGYVPARGLLLLLLVSVAHAAVLAPMTPISDALALGSAMDRPGVGRPGVAKLGVGKRGVGKRGVGKLGGRKAGFEYGWVRAAGSAAFIVGTLSSGLLVDRFGLGIIIWLNAALLAATAGCGWLVPNRLAGTVATAGAAAGAIRSLLAIPLFRRLMVVAALIGGSHALHDSFEVIRWRTAGLTGSEVSVLWSLSVTAEMVVFLLVGRRLVERLGPARAAGLSALAGVVRWTTASQTAWFPAMALVEPLHGLTFALLHLTCMDVIGRTVPARFAATAQAFYATIAMGATSALVTLVAGPMYGQYGPGAFWAMAAMCAAAFPLALRLRDPSHGGGRKAPV